ncbi:MAG: phage tail protein [Methanomassiliicoccaceae archaeon]|nr:phage tail protein [Methanomassiliicoccaceae archaeon]
MADNTSNGLPDIKLGKYSVKELIQMSDSELSTESVKELIQMSEIELDKLSGRYELALKDLLKGDGMSPCSNNRFRVEIDGIQQAGFFKCTGLGTSIEVIPYDDGVSQKAQRLTSRVSYSNVKLTWGVTASRELYDWHKNAINGNIIRKNVKITLIDETGKDLVSWHLTNAWPCAWEGPNFTALGTDVAVESITLVYDGIS